MNAKVGAGERLSVTLLFSIIAHAVIVLGLTFEYVKPAPRLPSLDVILVQSASGKKPEKADFLANANNEGGGTSEKAVRPTDLVSAPVPKADPGIAPMPMETGAREPQPASEREVLTQKKSTFAVNTQTQTVEQPDTADPNPRAQTDRKLEMARLANELQNQTQVYAKRPKKKYISANTKEAADAAYQAGWVARIERIGNLNYPDEARRQQLQNGKVLTLMLTAGIRRDGSLSSVDIVQSSGFKLLDEAAMRIVRLAAPFPPLPSNMDYDELYITRTWEFQPGEVLKTR
ncbi:MAG: energy transducer TonB [Rudaea sp.]|uniref:energy transducer TonB n=1 Tax=unclassified Rudaea TaxID=2627037 RepID=UPI0010F777B6|nr:MULTISPECIES: energy transducer TonB [unclassified Rudaea]MBN8888313.1 energy transducer TonB [Rudaea sp.]MBR0346756.1 energy transducer TonB [Rudaea sp.]